ncbi:MAG: AarF/UbiB family protein, partial [Myxococcota bacterium]
ARLQRGATPLDAALVRAEIEAGLGAPVDVLFPTFDDTPVAAASIGQVHRARVGGVPVAVKVRYPGVREAIATDTHTIERVAGMASLATAVDGRALARELRARLLEECDFRREAAWLAAAGRHLRGTDDVAVPTLVADRSCASVLTTHWVDGARFEALRAAPAPAREAAGRALLRFTWTSLLRDGFLHADPHPGNFLFGDRVTVLDWGCVRRFDAAEVEPLRALLGVVARGERAAFADALVAAGLVPDVRRFDVDAAWEMFGWMWAPYTTPRFAFTTEWCRAGARFSGPRYPNQRRQAFPPAWIWILRVGMGVHALLARLGATLDARAVLDAALAAPLVPIADPTE